MHSHEGTPRSGKRPLWRTAAAAFCAATVLFTAARDLLLPAIGDVEVWFGFELHGRAARLTAPLHWAIFAAFAWAFWRGWPRVVPAAASYLLYVALSHLVWNVVNPHGYGWLSGLAQAAVIALAAAISWRAHAAAASA